MVSFPTPKSYIFNNFKGIRTRNGIALDGAISATECKNVDFKPCAYDASINIVTSLGNVAIGTYTSSNDLNAYTYENHTIYIKPSTTTYHYYCFTADGVKVYADGTGENGSEITTIYSYPDRVAFANTSGTTYTFYWMGHQYKLLFTSTQITLKDHNNNTYTMSRSSDDDLTITSNAITSSTTLYDADGNVNADTNWAIALSTSGYAIQYDGHDAEYTPADNIYEFKIINGFETVQEGVSHLLLYLENSSIGRLVEFDTTDNIFTTLIDNLTLSDNGEANGITLIDHAYAVFAFTNGNVYYTVQFYPTPTVIAQLTPQYTDDDNTTISIKGLALCEYHGALVIGGKNGIVLASSQTDITDFDVTGGLDTSAWLERFGKPVTAVVPYIDSILVFTEDDSTVLTGYYKIATRERYDASLGGCMSFESWCKHDKYLFFYDNKQKNVYYYMQNNYGQKVLGEPIAPEVQEYFNDISKLQMTSYIGNNRSEIWLLSDKFKLIFDYYVQEWAERDCQAITSYFVYNNDVYSTSGAKVLREKAGSICLFDGVYYPATYAMQLINLGSFSNAKEMDIYPLLSVTQDYNNSFYLDCTIDGKKTKSKKISMYSQGAIWADTTAQTEATPYNELWDIQTFPYENDRVIQQVKGKIIPFWYYLQFTVRTEERGDDFSIACFELKGITQETDTIGRK